MPQGILVLDLEGSQLTREEAGLLTRNAVAGVILFSRNFQSLSQLIDLVQEIRAVNPDLLIMTDQEGGRVQRFRDKGFTRIPAMGVFGSLYSSDTDKAQFLLRETGWLLASELGAAGIDLGLSPVLDLDRGISRVIGDRGFSSDPEQVAVLAKAFIDGLHEGGMASMGKHFPGHGGISADSHIALPVDRREMSELEQDLTPYRKLIGQGLDAVMPAHVQFPAVDEQPAGFSKYWLKTVLREQLEFKGAVFSDCLSMAGASVGGSVVERAEKSLEAGCDLVLVCNNRKEAVKVVDSFDGYTAGASERQAVLQTIAGGSAPVWGELESSERRHNIIQSLSFLSKHQA